MPYGSIICLRVCEMQEVRSFVVDAPFVSCKTTQFDIAAKERIAAGQLNE